MGCAIEIGAARDRPGCGMLAKGTRWAVDASGWPNVSETADAPSTAGLGTLAAGRRGAGRAELCWRCSACIIAANRLFSCGRE